MPHWIIKLIRLTDITVVLFFRAMIDKNKVVVKCRMLIVGDRFYAIQVYTPMEKSLNDDINRYLNSFRLKEKNQKVIR